MPKLSDYIANNKALAQKVEELKRETASLKNQNCHNIAQNVAYRAIFAKIQNGLPDIARSIIELQRAHEAIAAVVDAVSLGNSSESLLSGVPVAYAINDRPSGVFPAPRFVTRSGGFYNGSSGDSNADEHNESLPIHDFIDSLCLPQRFRNPNAEEDSMVSNKALNHIPAELSIIEDASMNVTNVPNPGYPSAPAQPASLSPIQHVQEEPEKFIATRRGTVQEDSLYDLMRTTQMENSVLAASFRPEEHNSHPDKENIATGGERYMNSELFGSLLNSIIYPNRPEPLSPCREGVDSPPPDFPVEIYIPPVESIQTPQNEKLEAERVPLKEMPQTEAEHPISFSPILRPSFKQIPKPIQNNNNKEIQNNNKEIQNNDNKEIQNNNKQIQNNDNNKEIQNNNNKIRKTIGTIERESVPLAKGTARSKPLISMGKHGNMKFTSVPLKEKESEIKTSKPKLILTARSFPSKVVRLQNEKTERTSTAPALNYNNNRNNDIRKSARQRKTLLSNSAIKRMLGDSVLDETEIDRHSDDVFSPSPPKNSKK